MNLQDQDDETRPLTAPPLVVRPRALIIHRLGPKPPCLELRFIKEKEVGGNIPHILVIEVLSPSMDLILQREVKCHVLYALPWEHFGSGCIVHSLEMADHVGKPDSQTIVAGESKAWS